VKGHKYPELQGYKYPELQGYKQRVPTARNRDSWPSLRYSSPVPGPQVFLDALPEEGIEKGTLDLADAGLVGRYEHSSLHRA